MANIVIVGAQWGDEGKGKIVDLLTEQVQVVARFNGGHNAGHTILIEDERFVLHMIPAGILHAGILCVMGNGMVIDPWALEKEVAELRGRGVAIDDNLVISDRAHLILPHHRALETLYEAGRGDRKIGTTQRGIGPAYEDKAARRGIRVGDLLRPGDLHEKLAESRRLYEMLCRGAGAPSEVDWDALAYDLTAFGDRLRPRITDASLVLHRQLAMGYSVLFEGAQSTLLDIDHGSYPFVTSSSGSAGGCVTGLGIPISCVDGVVGIAKAYCTRVGSGPFPSEIGGEVEEQIRQKGKEFGASTGRPRRCGWFDAVGMRYAMRINGFDSVAIMKLDVLDGLDEVPICVGYRVDGATVDEMPSDPAVLAECEPVYERMPGWKESSAGVRDFALLPANAQRYIDRLAELTGVEIGIVSTGPNRHETILRSKSAMAAWWSH